MSSFKLGAALLLVTSLAAAQSAQNPGSGGSGTPGGSNTQCQFNDSGSFGGDAGCTYDKTTDTLTVGSVVATASGGEGGNFKLTEGTTPASGPAAGVAFCYADSTLHGVKCSFNNGTYVNLADATGIQNQSYIYAADAQANDSYVVTLSPAPSAYATGQHFTFKANTANTGAATLNVNSLGAKTIKKVAGGVTTDLSDNDIRSGQLVDVVYDGTNFQMQSTLGNAASGSGIGSILGGFFSIFTNASTTQYCPVIGGTLGGSSSCSGTESDRAVVLPVACTAQKLYIYLGSAQPATGSQVVTLRKGSTAGTLADTTVTVTIAANATTGTYSDTSHTVSLSAGDYVSLKVVNNATSTAGALYNYTFVCQ
jgi:hypothetical protein